MKRRVLVSAMLLAFSFGKPSFATGIPVIDVSNLSQNLITAIEQTTNTITSGKQLIEDMKQTLNTFPIIEQISKSEELAQLIQLVQAAQGLQGALTSSKNVFDNFGSAFSVSQYTSFEEFVNSVARRKEQGDKSAKSLYDSAKLAEDQIAKAFEAHLGIMTGMPMIEGVTQAAQATTNSVGVVIQQQQAMLAMMSATTRDSGVERQRQYDERAKLEEAYRKYWEDRKANNKSDATILKSLAQ